MLWIQEPVVFMRGEGRGHNQYTVFGLGCEFVPDAGKFSGRRGAPPQGWKIIDSDAFGRQIVRNSGSDQNQIRRGIVRVEMNKIFQHGQGLVFGGVRQTSARTRPAPAVKKSTFTIERGARIRLAQHAIDLPQKIGLN